MILLRRYKAVADIVMGFLCIPRSDATVKRCFFSNSWSSCVDNLTVARLKCAAIKRNYALGIKRIVSSSSSPSLQFRRIIYWSWRGSHHHQFIIITIAVKSNYTLVIKRISLQLICPTTTGTSVHYIRLMCTNANHPAYKATWAFHMRPLLLVFAPFMHAK